MRRARSPELEERVLHDMQLALQCLRLANRKNITRKGYAWLRKRVYNGDERLDKPIREEVVRGQLAAIDEVGPADLPPSHAVVRITLETMCMRHHALTEQQAWRMIGIPRKRGKKILWGDQSCITWPEWCLLWDAGVGPAHHSTKPRRWSPRKDFQRIPIGG